jgi:hypothetical protein
MYQSLAGRPAADDVEDKKLGEGSKGNMNRVEAVDWARTAAWVHEVLVGGGEKVFRRRFADCWPAGLVWEWDL